MQNLLRLSYFIAVFLLPPGALIGCSKETKRPLVLHLDLIQTTVSGVSSGGYMATQFHIAHSDWVRGSGAIASGPYYCARNSLQRVLSDCITTVEARIDLDALDRQSAIWEQQGLIAPLDNLRKDKAWILSGTLDKKVTPPIVNQLYEQLKNWLPEENITFVKNKAFAHHFPTREFGRDCDESVSPYIGKCGYDAAGEILNYLYGELAPPTDAERGNLISIDQASLAPDNGKTLGKKGYLYIPTACATGKACRLHIAFHGCGQNADTIGAVFSEQTGYNRWAESNAIVILYPQTRTSRAFPANPKGCWDWWGYTGERYATREGKQIKAVVEIVESLSRHR